MNKKKMNKEVHLLAVFPYLDDLLGALRMVRERGLQIGAVHSPVPDSEISALLEPGPSPVRLFTLCGGVLGVLLGFGVSAYTAWQWKFIVGGKAVIAPVPYVIVSFEFCILLAVFLNVAGFLLLSRLPKMSLPALYDPRVTEDRFSVLVLCPEGEREDIDRLLREAGAEEIHASD